MKYDLIIQGIDVATQDLKQLAKLSNVVRIEAIHQQAFRLVEADIANKPSVAAHCADAQLDFGFVPQSRQLRDFGLIVMDMDSTLITIECIDEIADMMNLKAQVSAITASAMRGEIDFQASLRQRVGLLAGLPEDALEKVYRERLKLSPGAEDLLSVCKKSGIKTLLVSGGFTFFTERLKVRLGLDYAASNLLETANGKLTGNIIGDIVDADAKAAWLVKTRDQLGLSQTQVAAIGDGANDLKMLAEAGVSVAYHAKAVVQEKANYALNVMGLDGVLPLLGKHD